MLSKRVAALSSIIRHFLVSQSQSPEFQASHQPPHLHSYSPKHTHTQTDRRTFRKMILSYTDWQTPADCTNNSVQTGDFTEVRFTNSTRLSSNNACHCKTLWISAGNDLIIHYTLNITRQQQQHTTDIKYTFTLPSTNATACYCERKRYHLRKEFQTHVEHQKNKHVGKL